jgi:glyoxylase-like metal-dependent hydrolase (beta-lactamase superfamily II)
MAGPVQLASGVWRIPTIGANLVNSFAFEEADGTLTLVDTGSKGSGPKRVVAGLASLGKRPDQVRRILLTHAHVDHAGGAARVAARTGATLQTHEVEAEHLRAGTTPGYNRHNPIGLLLDLWRPKLEVCEVGATYRDGELLDVAGGLRVLHTPGHTPGHCSFLHEPTGVLITGDSMFNFLDRTTWSFAFFCTDPEMAKDTAERLGDAEYEIAAFTHGPEMRGNARERIREFLRRKHKR